MGNPFDTPSVYAWPVVELPDVIKVGDDILLVHGKEMVHVFAMPFVKLNDVLKALHEYFPQLGIVPLELMSNDRSSPSDGGAAHD